MVRLLFICMCNICRSPTAEAVFRHMTKQAGVEHLIECDSAGTHNYHVNEPPDDLAQQAASRRGYDMSNLRARQVCEQDFEQFDYLLAMDRPNLALLKRQCLPSHAHKVSLFCDFHEHYAGQEVPDPHYGHAQGFDRVIDMIEQITESLISRLVQPGTPEKNYWQPGSTSARRLLNLLTGFDLPREAVANWRKRRTRTRQL